MGLGGGSSSATPPAPTVFPVNLLQTEQTGIAADTLGYNLSDADFAGRFPGLVAARSGDINRAYKEMTGPLDPTLQNQFATNALGQSLSAFGAGNENASVTGPGSIGRNTAATSVANQTMGYQDAARSYFEQLLASNPQRAFGLNGADLLNLSILNQGNIANANQTAAGISSQVGAANAARSASTQNAAIGAGVSIASALIQAVH